MPSREIRSCFVTGGTGFVGSHLVDLLLDGGCEVRCLVRDRTRLRWLQGKPVTLLEGDLGTWEVLREGVSGVDAVFHLAGVTAARSRGEYFSVNSEGSQNVARAALEAASPPGLFLFMSSLAALGPGRTDEAIVEERTAEPVTDYGRSKLEGEKRLGTMEDLPLVVVRPSAVYGPRDREVYPLFRLAARGIVPIFNPSARLSLIHVEDLARGGDCCRNRRAHRGSLFPGPPGSRQRGRPASVVRGRPGAKGAGLEDSPGSDRSLCVGFRNLGGPVGAHALVQPEQGERTDRLRLGL